MGQKLREYFVHDIFVDRRHYLFLLAQYVSVSNWYYVFSGYYIPVLSKTLAEGQMQWIRFIFDFSIGCSILSICLLIKRINPYHLILGSSVASSIMIVLLTFVSGSIFTLPAISFLGAVCGVAVLANAIIFFDQTEITERGRAGGMLVSTSTLTGPLLFSLVPAISPQMICFFLNIISASVILLKPKGYEKRKNTDKTLKKPSGNFGYYFLSWTILCLNNGILQRTVALYLAKTFPQYYNIDTLLQFAFVSFAAIISGILADWFGRKIVLVSGFLIYGVANTIVGFALTPVTQFIAYPSSGLSWGFFLAIFYLVIWGETDGTGNVILSYALALTVFHINNSLAYIVEPYIMGVPIVSVLFLSSLLVFIGLIPLFLARETVPEDLLKKIWFDSYKKWAKGFTKKNGE
ncbi:MAG: hypothetical protein V1915_01320 [Candidatus Bathyarchaeota archaeon]